MPGTVPNPRVLHKMIGGGARIDSNGAGATLRAGGCRQDVAKQRIHRARSGKLAELSNFGGVASMS